MRSLLQAAGCSLYIPSPTSNRRYFGSEGFLDWSYQLAKYFEHVLRITGIICLIEITLD